MAEQDLKCNILTCRSTLSSLGKACVTTCSHIFCVGCANKAFDTALVCPACETSLTQQDDIVFVDLNPSQEYRSSILSGLRPDVIMEICTRAVSFWTYQTSQEAKYQEMTQKTLEDKVGQLERQLQRMTREVNVELNGFRDTVSGLQKDIEQEKHKSADLTDQLDEKSRQLSNLQTMYDRQKRRPLFPDPSSQQNRPLFTDDALPTAAVHGDPYQLYQSMDTDATTRPFATRSMEGHNSMPLFTTDPATFVYDPPTAHPVHPTLTAPSMALRDATEGRAVPPFGHAAMSQRLTVGTAGAERPLPSGLNLSQHSVPSQQASRGYHGPGTTSFVRM
ncbi:hypothetical protein BGX23_000415 [Mortierella sp. AD031]|nr:hypothetical protein BGX23_000415 [Mortierella sp. AD031]